MPIGTDFLEANAPWLGVSLPQTPSIYDVQRRQALAQQLLSGANTQINPSNAVIGPLNALAAGLGTSFGDLQNTTAAQEAQQGTTQANQALATALQGGPQGVYNDPSKLATAEGNPFLTPAEGQLGSSYLTNAEDLARPMAILPGTSLYTPLTHETTSTGPSNGSVVGTTGNPTPDPTAKGYYTDAVPGSGGLTQAYIDQHAASNIATGTFPTGGGRGGLAQLQNAAIANRMAEMGGGADIAGNKASFKAFGTSLSAQQKYLDNTQRAFNTANDTLASLQNFMQQNNINPSQFPDYNQFVNFLSSHGADAGTIAGYNAQLQTLRAEYSQVLAKGGARSVETDRAAAQLIPDGLAPAQLAKVAAQVQIDSQNAIRDAQAQIKQINGQVGGLGTSNAPAVAPSAPDPNDPLGILGP